MLERALAKIFGSVLGRMVKFDAACEGEVVATFAGVEEFGEVGVVRHAAVDVFGE